MHSTAGVAIRQIVTALFDRLPLHKREEKTGEEEEGRGGEGEKEGEVEQQLSREAGDAYLLFQVITYKYRYTVLYCINTDILYCTV